MNSTFTFMMLFDDSATPMLEAVMASGMALRFPACKFELERTRNPDFADMVIPIAATQSNDDDLDSFTMTRPPGDLTNDVQEAFDDLLREARAARPS
jgi:hypothetical protein